MRGGFCGKRASRRPVPQDCERLLPRLPRPLVDRELVVLVTAREFCVEEERAGELPPRLGVLGRLLRSLLVARDRFADPLPSGPAADVPLVPPLPGLVGRGDDGIRPDEDRVADVGCHHGLRVRGDCGREQGGSEKQPLSRGRTRGSLEPPAGGR